MIADLQGTIPTPIEKIMQLWFKNGAECRVLRSIGKISCTIYSKPKELRVLRKEMLRVSTFCPCSSEIINRNDYSRACKSFCLLWLTTISRIVSLALACSAILHVENVDRRQIKKAEIKLGN